MSVELVEDIVAADLVARPATLLPFLTNHTAGPHHVILCNTPTVGDKIKFPLCTDSPPTCERSCQQKLPKSRPKVASDFRRTLNVMKKVSYLFLSGEKIVCARIQFRPKS